jgi:metallo-beta-lactamase family protein
MRIGFLGATQTVTGSRFLLEHDGTRVLVDCGLFQGPREWKERNWAKFPEDPSTIDSVILTHAHIDHSGYLPRFRSLGFRGPVYCTPATGELLALLLPDAGHLQEEDAAFANKKKYTTHAPALPLYTEEQARKILHTIHPVDYYTSLPLSPGFSFSFLRAGHILGSAMVEFKTNDRSVVFSGDLGRPNQHITRKPDDLRNADWLILESTYGNRLHQTMDVRLRLAEIIKQTAAAGGTLVVPAFAIGRTQELLFLLRQLEEAGTIPQLPVFLDSPMAIHALPIYSRTSIDSTDELAEMMRKDSTPFVSRQIRPLITIQESMTLNQITFPCIIISSSGMATGGRILHHLKRRISDHRNTVLFIGFQAQGTKGRFLVEGAQEIKIHGKQYPVRANIEYMDALSCHADYEEILHWLASIRSAPKGIFLVHGEKDSSTALAEKIEKKLGWNARVPAYLESVEVT